MLLRRETTDDRRIAIAAAARALIVEKGLEALRTRDIAERVGINVATLHYHVPTKEALIALVAETIRGEFRAQYERHSRDGMTGLAELRQELADFEESVTDMPDLSIVWSELFERARRDQTVADIMYPMYEFWLGQWVALFARGKADGTLRPDIDPQTAAFVVTGALSDYWRRYRLIKLTVPELAVELERAFINPKLHNS